MNEVSRQSIADALGDCSRQARGGMNAWNVVVVRAGTVSKFALSVPRFLLNKQQPKKSAAAPCKPTGAA
jgi:hypothetical protein